MKKYLLLFIAVSLAFTTAACAEKTDVQKNVNEPSRLQSPAQSTVETEKSYIGTINGSLNIHMKLKFKRSEVSGTYYYEKYKIGLQLKGTMDNQKDIVMAEYDPSGKMTGKFNAKFTTDTKIEGTWLSPDDKTKMSFSVNEYIPGKDESAQTQKTNSWSGDWTRIGRNGKASYFQGASITISKVTAKSFNFSISANNGADMGSLDGAAKVSGNTAAYTDEDGKYKLEFALNGENITVKTSGETTRYCGLGVDFDGNYKRGSLKAEAPTLVESGVFKNSQQEKEFKKLAGDEYERFKYSFQLVNSYPDEEGLGATVYVGSVRGIGDSAIIMYTPDNKVWAAVLGFSIFYYTNTPDKEKMPKEIEQWTKKFNGAYVDYRSK